MYEGSLEPKVLFVSDFQRADERGEGVILSEARKAIIVNALNRAGVPESEYGFVIMYPMMPRGADIKNLSQEERVLGQLACKKAINDSKANVIVPLGDHALSFITGLENIQNQKCSILRVKAEFGARKAIPLPHPEYIQRVREESAYISFGCQRIKEEMSSNVLSIPERKFRLSLDYSFEEVIAILEGCLNAPELAIDIESGRGIVNTHGFAISPTEAIAIDVQPSSYKPIEFHKLWSVIKRILESDIPKIVQNGVFESEWASLYGIELRNVTFDTQWAMKLLHPSLEKGLDNVGRIYTRYPYWKGDQSDWNNVRNWRNHLEYNCKDTTGTFAAKVNMQAALEAQNLMPLFKSYMDHIFPKCQSMSNRGIAVSKINLESLKDDLTRNLDSCTAGLDKYTETYLQRKINPNSPKQVKDALKELGFKVPTKNGKDTVSQESLIKMRKNYPKDDFLRNLVEISKVSNQLETYYNFKYDSDGKLRFSTDAIHNEYGEWSSYKNPFGSGFSMDEVSKKTKSFLIADEGHEFLELSLHWPEMRYLAYDSGDQKMIGMVNKHQNVSVMLAEKMFRKALVHEKSQEARIAEQTLYAAAYAMSPRAFATKMMGEWNFSMTEIEARRYMQIVIENFPGLIKRQFKIQDQIKRSRSITNLLGRSITYYDRLNDDLFKKAYQWGFRSLKADILNHLMAGFKNDEVVVRNNDVILITKREESMFENHWEMNQFIKTSYGVLEFPVRLKVGKTWGGVKSV